MITEDYVSFEIAKLLKEKGFSENTICKYADVGGITERWYDDYREKVLYFDWKEGYLIEPLMEPKDQYEIIGDTISAPTHQMALKWLREVHHLQICVSSYSNRWEEYVHGWQFLIKKLTFTEGIGWNWDDSLDAITDKKMSDDITYITYEQAVEAAIKYTLENLI